MQYISAALVLEEYLQDLEAIWDETDYTDLKKWLFSRISEHIDLQ